MAGRMVDNRPFGGCRFGQFSARTTVSMAVNREFGRHRFGGCHFSEGTVDSMVVNGPFRERQFSARTVDSMVEDRLFGGRHFREGIPVSMAVNGQFAGHRFDGFGSVQWQGEDLAAHSYEQDKGGFENSHVC